MDSYSTCFCGSGDKYKFCCQKAESHIFKVEKLIESQQHDAAITAVTEGLKRFPEAAMLVLQKAVLEVQTSDFSAARRTLESFLAKHNKHIGALSQFLLVVMELEGPLAAVKELQRISGRLTDSDRQFLSKIPAELANGLLELNLPVAAIGHQRLAVAWSGRSQPMAQRLSEITMNAAESLWLRQLLNFKPIPEGVSQASKQAFDAAYVMANRGQWLDAAAAFEALTDRDVIGPATYNRGIVLAYIGENASAIACFRAFIGTLGQTDEAVDLEAFCQELGKAAETGSDDTIMLTWPIRSRKQIEESLSNSNQFVDITATSQIQQNEEFDASKTYFILLDRPQLDDPNSLTLENVASVAGSVVIEDKNVMLTATDNGRLDQWADQLRDIAGSAIVPAHPRTKHVGKKPRPGIFSEPAWMLPSDLPEAVRSSLKSAYIRQLVEKVLPSTPMKALRGLTIDQYAASDQSKVPLRGLMRRFELLADNAEQSAIIDDYRTRLNLPKEGLPESFSITELNVTRLKYVDVTALNLGDLQIYCQIASNYGMRTLTKQGLAELINRKPEDEAGHNLLKQAYVELAFLTASDGGFDEGLELLKTGQDADPKGQTTEGRLDWDLIVLRLRGALTPPEVWVPALAVLLDQHKTDKELMNKIFMALVSMGLLRPVQDPSRPDKITVDSSLLDFLLDKFGPKITTPTGGLGVSAGKPQIWTPGSESPRSGNKLWTPGGQSQAKPDQSSGPDTGSKLIIPGR